MVRLPPKSLIFVNIQATIKNNYTEFEMLPRDSKKKYKELTLK